MIEKLKTINPYEETEIDMDIGSVNLVYQDTPLIQKINELVDVVNELHEEAENNARIRADHEHKIEALQDNQDTYWTDIGEIKAKIAKGFENLKTPAENVQDKFAEQRKWIGKICKFWNWDTGLAHYSKLITIKDINDGVMSNCPFRADDGGWYMYCEPVKPDEDIIYKGDK